MGNASSNVEEEEHFKKVHSDPEIKKHITTSFKSVGHKHRKKHCDGRRKKHKHQERKNLPSSEHFATKSQAMKAFNKGGATQVSWSSSEEEKKMQEWFDQNPQLKQYLE